MKQLFDNLMNVCQGDKSSMYFVDQEIDGGKYRIFLYRIASYTEFTQPDALWARGTTFQINDNGEPVRIACRPFPKFFNLGENPMVMGLDINDFTEAYTKEDGSLISSYMSGERLRLKTKGSLHSEQVGEATKWLEKNHKMENFLNQMLVLGYTTNLEWCAPTNRIVLGYAEPRLVILGAIRIKDGYEMPVNEVDFMASNYGVSEFLVELHQEGSQALIDRLNEMTGVEGFVLRNPVTGMRVKVKTEWYAVRHRLKDSVNNEGALFEAVIGETTDDIKAMFQEDPVTIQIIENMENKVRPAYSKFIKDIERFYEENKHLSRKDYAIKATALNNGALGLYMNLYSGKPADYKGWAIKYRERFLA